MGDWPTSIIHSLLNSCIIVWIVSCDAQKSGRWVYCCLFMPDRMHLNALSLHSSERSSLRVIHLHRCTDCFDGDAPVWMKLTSEVGTRPLLGFIPHLVLYRSRGGLTVLALSGWVISSPAAAPAGFLEHCMILEDPAFHAEEHESYVVQRNSRFTEAPSLFSKASYTVIHSVLLLYSKPRNYLF